MQFSPKPEVLRNILQTDSLFYVCGMAIFFSVINALGMKVGDVDAIWFVRDLAAGKGDATGREGSGGPV